jgi:hypothetical protein
MADNICPDLPLHTSPSLPFIHHLPTLPLPSVLDTWPILCLSLPTMAPQTFLGRRHAPHYDHLLSCSTNPFRNSHFRSRHSSRHCKTYIRRCAFHNNGCSLSRPDAGHPRRFWQVYIARQSFPWRSGDQAIQRSFRQHHSTCQTR